MKKFLSILITILMLMQMFAFSVSSEESQYYTYWTGEGPGEIVFGTIEGMSYYSIKLYKDGKLVEETSHSTGDYQRLEVEHNFLNEIIENGKGVYIAEVIYEDGISVKTGNYRYIAPSNSLEKPGYIEFNQEKNYIVWGEVADAVLYEVKFVFSIDGGNSFCDMNSYLLEKEDGTFFDFWGNVEEELKWIEESYQQAIIDHETTAENFLRAVQVAAYPIDLNKANPSYSDYVTFDGIIIPDDGDDNAGDGSYSYMEIVDYQNEYELGQDFYADLRLVYVSNDGTETYTIISSKDCIIEGFAPYTPGWQEVTIWHGDESVTCDVFIRGEDTVPVYTVDFENVKNEYEYGEDFYIEVYRYNEYGEKIALGNDEWWVEGFDPYMPGWQTVTVFCENRVETYEVYVNEKSSTDGSIGYIKVSMPNVEFFPGDEFYAEVYIYTPDGSCYKIEDYKYEGFDSYIPGEQIVTIWYGNLSTTVTVWVYEEEPVEPSYTVTFENVKTKYEYGEEFYAEAWIANANGEYYQAEGWWVEGYDPYMSGWQTVTLWYGDYCEYYKVYVGEKEDGGNTSEFVENVYWAEELPGQVNFTMIDGVDRYRIRLYRNGALITEVTHSYGGSWWQNEGYHQFLKEICTNGSGTYRAEVAPDDGNGNYTASEDYVYKRPSRTLEKPQNVVLDRDALCITWDEVPDARYYDVCFGYSTDGGESFFMMSSTQILPEYDGCYYDMQNDIKWLEDDYIRAAENNGIAIDDLIRVMQIVALPTNLNNANISYSDYVTFEAITIPDDDEEESSDSVTFENVKTKYEYGEEFYAEAWITDANGEYYQAEGWWVEGYDPCMSGWQTVTLWYGDYCEYYKVYVAEKENTDTTGYIKIVDYQREYYPGMEFYADLLVWEETDDGSMVSYIVNISDCIVEGFDSYMPGEQIVTIWYNDYCIDCYVTVYPEEPGPVYTVEFENVKTEYEYGEEFYIEVYRYIDGEKIAVGNDEWWVEGYDPYMSGWQTVAVFCENRVETYEVYVNEKEDTDRIAEVYWTGERPAQIYFTFVPGVKTYSIKVLKDDKEIYSHTRDFKRYDRDEGGKFSLRDVILENGEGIYQVGVAPVFDGFMDTGKYTLSEMLIYREPEDILPCVNGVTYNLDTYEIMWTPIEEAAEYDVVFCYSPDGGEHFYPVTAYGAEEDGYFNFYGEAEYELQWLKEEYASYAKAEGLAVEDLIMAVQIKAFPLNLNDAAPSASKYVIFWETEPVPGIRDVRVERLKKQYYEGEEIEAEIWYETEDGRHEFTEDFEVEGYDAYFIGEQNVTISFGGYSEDFTVTVKPRPIIDENVTHIRIKNFKTLYYLGEEFEAEVYAYRDDGSCYMVEDYLYYDFDSSIIGEQSVMVRYGDFTDACIVCVYEEELTESLSGTCGDNLTWVLDTNGVLTISGTGAMENYENTNGMPWYDNRGRIKEIIIEEGVTSIGKHAFAWCYSLTNVTIPYSVTEISDYAFYACTALPYIMIPDNATIGSFAFSSCKRIENVDFGSNVTIGEWAFSSCESLTNVNIHADMIIGDCVFRYCESLENINVDDSNPYYCSIDGNLFDKNKTTLIQYAIGKKDTHYEIPEGVTVIGEAAFDTCTKLTSITIPNSVTSVYEYAFRDCKNLVDVYYNGTDSEFYSIVVNGNNEPLYDATIHFNENPEPSYSVTFENVKTEYEYGEEFYIEVYEYTAEGEKVAVEGWEVHRFDSTVPGEQRVTVTYGDYSATFTVYVNDVENPTWWEYDAANLELIIKEQMGNYDYNLNEGISDAPWHYLRNEVEVITICDGVTDITEGVFMNFTNLREVNLGGTVNKIGICAFERCTALEYIAMPDSVYYIAPRAFANSGLRAIDFGNGLTQIDSSAFQNCKFESISLPESLRTIGISSFIGCRNLVKVYIPTSVKRIMSNAFGNCIMLADVYYGGTQEEWDGISIEANNEHLSSATIHFAGEEPMDTYTFENVKTEYEYGEDFYAEVWITDAEGNRWQADSYEIFGFDPYMSGWQTVTLRYDYYEESFEVFVSEKEEEPYIVSVDFELLKDTYYRGEELKIYVYENMSDGTCNRVYDFDIVNFDSTRLGQQMVTINYKGFGEQFVIMVEARPSSGGGGGGGGYAGPSITVSEEKCRVGNTVEVAVSIERNVGFANLGIEIEYDRALRLIDVIPNEDVGATFTPAQDYDVYPYNIDFTSTSNVHYDGELVKLVFEVPEGTPTGDYFVNVDFYKGREGNYIDGDNVNYDADENPLNLCYESGYVTVYDYIPGDINGNGVVDNKDGTALLRYLAGWTLEQIDYNALDVDGNGTVDNKDGTRLLRYLAGWDVEVY